MTRLIYSLAGVFALYRAIAPLISNMPTPHPWVVVAFWISGISLLLSGLGLAEPERPVWAFVGSLVVVCVYVYGVILLPLALRFGLVHVSARLVATKANWFDRWRPLVDRPVWILLLILAVLALWVSARAMHSSRAN